MNYIIFHLDKNGFHLSQLENFSKSLLPEPCMNQAQGFKCRFFTLLPTLIVTKLVKKTECDWYVNPKYVLVLKNKGMKFHII